MITTRTIGEELEKELGKEFGNVLKEQKKKRDLVRKKHRGKTLDFVETSWTWTSGNYNKWYLKTSVEGRIDKPTVTSHAHVTVISGSGSDKYLIPRGYKKRPGTGEIGGYAISVRASLVREIKESLDLADMGYHEVVSRIFNHTEKAVYLPCDWDMDAESTVQEEKPEDYVPTADEIWAEYLGQGKKEPEKKKKHEGLPQFILKTSLGFFLGCIRGKKEVILEVFMKEEDFEGEAKEKIAKVLNPAYELYNTDDVQRVREIQKQVERDLVGDEEVFVLYP